MTTAQEYIVATVSNTTLEDTKALVTEWCNASEVDIDDGGNIWIANPQRGHWLDAEKMDDFVAWCERNTRT